MPSPFGENTLPVFSYIHIIYILTMATRQLAAIMFTDMVGYTALMQENEHLALEKRKHNKTIFEASLAKYDGALLPQKLGLLY